MAVTQKKEMITLKKATTQFVELETYSDNENDETPKKFKVPKAWLLKLLKEMDSLNTRQGVNLDNFLQNYVYDETYAIYCIAESKNKLL